MATVYFPSLADADVIEVEFLKANSTCELLRLLVDSGFSGTSSVVLPCTATDLFWAKLPAKQIVGAIHGLQDRAWVTCRIPGLNFSQTVIAILADTSSLSLPYGVVGLAGLTFLRQFARWGAERTASGWQFVLNDGGP